METRARKRSKGSADTSVSSRKRSRNLNSNSNSSHYRNSPVAIVDSSKDIAQSTPVLSDTNPSGHTSRSANLRLSKKLERATAVNPENSKSALKTRRSRENSSSHRVVTSLTEPVTSPAAIEPNLSGESVSDTRAKLEELVAQEMERRGRASDLDDRDDDADNEDEGSASMSLNLASASSALHGLLRKLGAGLDDLVPNSSLTHSRLKGILVGLRAEGEEGKQLEALTSLCELLSIANEESLTAFSVDSFVPALVTLLNAEYSPDSMLLAARALTHLADVLPSACAAIVHYGAVNCFCARLLTIEYIDLAEQSLQALEKLSHEHPVACLRAGGLMAVLSYLDFFSTGVQRLAVTTAANMCRRLPLDASDMVVDCIPILTNLLTYQDSKLMEQACLCLSRISESFAASPVRIKLLCSQGLIEHAARLVSVDSNTPLSASTYTCMIRLLATCVAGSPDEALKFMQLGMTRTVKDSLMGSTMLFSSPSSPASLLRSSDQLLEFLSLVSHLLPPIPPSAPSSSPLPVESSPIPTRSSPRRPPAAASPPASLAQDVGGLDSSTLAEVNPREVALKNHPELLQQYGEDLLVVLVQVYGVSTSSSVRQKCLLSISRYFHFASANQLQSLLENIPISSFVASLLSSKESSVVMTGLVVAEVLMNKLPELFSKYFLKEGVVHAIQQLASSPTTSATAANKDGVTSPLSSTPPGGGALGGARRTTRHRPAGSDECAPSGSGGMRHSPGSSNKGMGWSSGRFSLSPASSPLTPASPSTSSLRVACVVRANSFKRNYPSICGDQGGVTKGLATLQRLASVLRDPNAGQEAHRQALKELLAELSDVDGISTFEFVGSGTVEALKQYLTAAGVTSKKVTKGEEELARIQVFWEVAEEASNCKAPPLPSLARKLQDTLTNLEKFPVFLSQGPRSTGGDNSSLGSQLVSLTHPFKLRLCRQTSDRTLKDYSSNIVLIEPLATLSAVEDFLWPRVKRSSNSESLSSPITKTSGGTSSSGPSSSAEAKVATKFGLESKSTKDGNASNPSKSPPTSSFSHLTRLKAKVTASNDKNNEKYLASSSRDVEDKSKGKGKLPVSGGDTPPVKLREGRLTRSATRNRQREESELENKRKVGRPDSLEDDGLLASIARRQGDDLDMDDEDMDEEMEDDEEDYYDEEDEDGVFGEALLACSDRVHDVQLSDNDTSTGSLSTSADTAKGTSPQKGSGSRTAGGSSVPPRFTEGGRRSRAQAAEGLGTGAGASASGSRRTAAAVAAAMAAATATPHLVFSLNRHKLQAGMTIFQAIQQSTAARDDEEEEAVEGDGEMEGEQMGRGRRQRLWEEVYSINYSIFNSKTDAAESSGSPEGSSLFQDLDSEPEALSSIPPSLIPLAPLLQAISPGKLNIPEQLHSVLLLLRLLDALARHGHQLSLLNPVLDDGSNTATLATAVLGTREELVSSKLSSKLSRQLQDVLTLCSGGIPSWCRRLTVTCPFLFPFDCRRQYFYCTAFSLSRALQRLQQQQAGSNGDSRGDRDTRELRVGRLQRQKVRVSRARILDSAVKVMELYCSNKAVLEVEYFGEVGTGLGPTLEFYTLVSQELQKHILGLWRHDATPPNPDQLAGALPDSSLEQEAEDVVRAPWGLFPAPISPAATDVNQTLERFRLLGRLMAKALQDGRLLDLPFAQPFYKALLGRALHLFDIRSLDPMLGVTLEELDLLCRRKQAMQASGAGAEAMREALKFRGCNVEDLGLDFTLPGYPDHELCTAGASTNVSLSNLEKYVEGVVDGSVGSGISRQMDAVRTGFQQVFSLSSLRLFSESELDILLCGSGEKWSLDTIQENIKCDHGYTTSSYPLQHFLQLLVEFGPEDQRAFLRFVTGSPRLPAGGLAALSPKLTIVRKHPSNSLAGSASSNSVPSSPASLESTLQGTTAADNDLPSVMTCANYLKLPPYSCKAIMKEKLLFAIHEGSASFDLS